MCNMQTRAVTILMILALSCAWLRAAQAQENTLTIRSLRDGGGLERGLNARLTTALARFLIDHAAKSVQVKTEGAPVSLPLPKAGRYTLEGDLTYANGADDQNARFLLVMRLFREVTPRALIGQWAGTADSLRSLTVNLRRDPRIHTLGLIGEMGTRIAACLSTDSASVYTQWTRMLPQSALQNSSLDIVSADDKARLLKQIEVGNSFRLRMRRDASCRVFLLLNDPANGLHLAHLSDEGECWTVRKGQSALSHVIMLPEGTREAWVVTGLPGIENNRLNDVSRRGITSYNPTDYIPTVATGLNTIVRGRRAFSQGFSTSGLCYIAEQNEAPVQILEGVGNQGSHSEPAPVLKQLLDEIANAPQAWRVQKLRITQTK